MQQNVCLRDWERHSVPHDTEHLRVDIQISKLKASRSSSLYTISFYVKSFDTLGLWYF